MTGKVWLVNMEKDIKYINKDERNEKKKLAVIILLLLLLLFVIVNYVESTEPQRAEEIDLTSPEIILDENNIYQMEVNSEIPTILAMGKDNKDRNVEIVVDTSNVNPNEVGEYIVTIIAKDDNENITTEEIILEVVDTIPPSIILNGNNIVYHQIDTEYIDEGVTVSDNYDAVEDIEISITSTVNEQKLGTYTVTYIAIDKAGNVSDEVTETVVVVDAITVILPKGTVKYSISESTYEPVTVTLTTNKEIVVPIDWTKIDALTYVKTYTDNITEALTITDLSGNTDIVSIKIENIKKRISGGTWNDIKGVNTPKLSNGMIPIKYNGTNWVVCSELDTGWYEYINQVNGEDGTSRWANIMLSDGVYKADTASEGQVVQESELRKYVCMDTEICIQNNKWM